jgi:hypothetical protein
VNPYARKEFNERPAEEYIPSNYESQYSKKKLYLNNPGQITTGSVPQLFEEDTKPEILSAEKLRSRIDQEKEKEMMKKLVGLRILKDEKKATVSNITAQGFEMDNYWKITKLFTILDNLDLKKKIKRKLIKIYK